MYYHYFFNQAFAYFTPGDYAQSASILRTLSGSTSSFEKSSLIEKFRKLTDNKDSIEVESLREKFNTPAFPDLVDSLSKYLVVYSKSGSINFEDFALLHQDLYLSLPYAYNKVLEELWVF